MASLRKSQSRSRACYELYRVCVEGKKVRVLGVRSAVWLFQISDEQRRNRTFLPSILRTALLTGRLRCCGSLIWIAKLCSPRLAANQSARLRKRDIVHNRL